MMRAGFATLPGAPQSVHLTSEFKRIHGTPHLIRLRFQRPAVADDKAGLDHAWRSINWHEGRLIHEQIQAKATSIPEANVYSSAMQ
jgi:hypothetical protein